MLASRRHFALLAGASLLLPRLGHAHTSSEQELTCPVDGTKLKVHVTMSYTTFGQLRDFAVQGAIGDLYAAYVHACPKCHFAGYQDDFEEPVAAATKTWQLAHGTRKWGARKLDPAQECEACADRYVFERHRPAEIAQLYLIGSYLLRAEKGGLLAKRKEYQRAASLYLLAALAANQVDKTDRGGTTYLVAELERRIGRFQDAIAHYGAALKEANNPAGLVTWIKEQRALAKNHDANNAL